MSEIKCHRCGNYYSIDLAEQQGLCPRCRLVCQCGETLEEGFMGSLWCPKCENNWKIPKDREQDPKYYFTIK